LAWLAKHRLKVLEGQGTSNTKSMQSLESGEFGEFEDRGSWKNVTEAQEI
jgi:hypothetical protein